MDSLRLPLFPEGSLASSVITTVFVGVWIVCFFNLRLGWAFSGLVVPGYLAPLFLAKPWAAGVVCAEAVTTYLVVWLLSERVSRWGLWCSFFGRDRFFALVLASVAVRLLGDVVLLPLAAEWANAHFGLEFDYHNNLHSYGLIVVALFANQLWKPGLARGLITASVPILLTCLFVRFVLMPFTNFSIGNLQYMYEDIAASLLASPKAYIILIATAFLASRMNLHYSWEFNGILIPALIALQWYEPLKVLMTVLESGAIYCLAVLLLRAPILRNQSFEGARKLLLFFSIGFAWKMALGFLLPAVWPAVRVSDYYGFGYLLATLLALKAHDKGIVVRMASATFQISLVGALVGCLIGFVLTLAPRPTQPAPGEEDDNPPARWLSEEVERETLARYERLGKPPVHADASQRHAFARGLRELVAYAQTRDPERLVQGRAFVDSVGYRVDEIEGRYLCLRERPNRRGWGLYVLAIGQRAGPAVLIASPRGEWTVESGAAMFERLDGRALAIAGENGEEGDRVPVAWLTGLRRKGLFDVFRSVVAGHHAISLRASENDSNRLQVKSSLPDGLDLARLRELLGEVEIDWQSGSAKHAELSLSRASRRRLLLDRNQDSPTGERARVERVTGRLTPWLLSARSRIADAGTNLYRPPTQRELLGFSREVLTPLLRLMQSWQASEENRRDLDAVALAASRFDYRVIWYSDPAGPADYFALGESEKLPRRHWGTYVFRPGGEPFAIQTPRPIFEGNTLEYSVQLFARLRARALLLHGAHPEANPDRSSDVLDPRHRLNLFSLVSQSILSEAGNEPLLVVQSRAFGVRPTGLVAEADALLASSNGTTTKSGLSELGKQVAAVLEKDRLVVRLTDGSRETMGYEATTAPQAAYLAQSRNKELLLVWLSPLSKPLYRQQADNRIAEAHFRAVDIATRQGDLAEFLSKARTRTKNQKEEIVGVPEELRRTVERYIAAQDVVVLHELTTRWPRVRFTRFIDDSSQQAFLLIETLPGQLALVANLGAPSSASASSFVLRPFSLQGVRRFVDERSTWLEVEGVQP